MHIGRLLEALLSQRGLKSGGFAMTKIRPVVITLSVLTTGAIFLLIASSALLAFAAMQGARQERLEQNYVEILEWAKHQQEQEDYQSCVREVDKIPEESFAYKQAQALLDKCKEALRVILLEEAQKLASAGYFRRAIDVANSIPGSSSDISVRQHIREWSESILRVAGESYRNGLFEDAIRFANAISQDNPLYHEAQIQAQQWQNEVSANQQHLRAARIALSSSELEIALAEVVQVSNHPFWEQEVESIYQSIEKKRVEQHYENLFNRALEALTLKQFEKANYLASQLPNTKDWIDQKTQIFEQVESARKGVDFLPKFLWGAFGAGLLLLMGYRKN